MTERRLKTTAKNSDQKRQKNYARQRHSVLQQKQTKLSINQRHSMMIQQNNKFSKKKIRKKKTIPQNLISKLKSTEIHIKHTKQITLKNKQNTQSTPLTVQIVCKSNQFEKFEKLDFALSRATEKKMSTFLELKNRNQCTLKFTN